jgi:hypothetical protein
VIVCLLSQLQSKRVVVVIVVAAAVEEEDRAPLAHYGIVVSHRDCCEASSSPGRKLNSIKLVT